MGTARNKHREPNASALSAWRFGGGNGNFGPEKIPPVPFAKGGKPRCPNRPAKENSSHGRSLGDFKCIVPGIVDNLHKSGKGRNGQVHVSAVGNSPYLAGNFSPFASSDDPSRPRPTEQGAPSSRRRSPRTEPSLGAFWIFSKIRKVAASSPFFTGLSGLSNLSISRPLALAMFRDGVIALQGHRRFPGSAPRPGVLTPASYAAALSGLEMFWETLGKPSAGKAAKF